MEGNFILPKLKEKTLITNSEGFTDLIGAATASGIGSRAEPSEHRSPVGDGSGCAEPLSKIRGAVKGNWGGDLGASVWARKEREGKRGGGRGGGGNLVKTDDRQMRGVVAETQPQGKGARREEVRVAATCSRATPSHACGRLWPRLPPGRASDVSHESSPASNKMISPIAATTHCCYIQFNWRVWNFIL